jgi:DNA-binding LacI/PurR family transcriptional regulator
MPTTLSAKPPILKPSKRVRLADVARAAGVSPATASMALRDHPEIAVQTREKVKRITASLGYVGPHIRPKSDGTDDASRRYGLLVLQIHDNPYIQALLDGVSQAAQHRANRIEIHVINDIQNAQRVIERTLNFISSVDGILICGWTERPLLEALNGQNFPFVTLGPFHTDPSLLPAHLNRAVMFDTRLMGQLATRYLIAQGHSRIGFVAEHLPQHMFNAGWFDGYRLALLDAGIPINQDHVFIGSGSGTGDQVARAVVKARTRPTAYVTPSAPPAALFLRTVRAHGIKIDPACFVVSGSQESLQENKLTQHPAIIRSLRDLASFGLSRLHQAILDGKPTLGTWNLPFQTQNMDVSILG